jgi:hypothetical protein
MAYVREPWYPQPAADYRLGCACAACCLATGREVSPREEKARRESLQLIQKMNWNLATASTK